VGVWGPFAPEGGAGGGGGEREGRLADPVTGAVDGSRGKKMRGGGGGL
jgi:hypothetical protein